VQEVSEGKAVMRVEKGGKLAEGKFALEESKGRSDPRVAKGEKTAPS